MTVTLPPRTLSLAPQRYVTNTGKQSELPEAQGLDLSNLGKAPTIRALKLRGYQQQINDMVARATLTHNCPLVVLPTGAGKTTVAAELARRMAAKGHHVWFVVHRIELAEQAVKRFCKSGLTVGLIAAGHKPDYTAQVQVVMVQTLSRRLASIGNYPKPNYIFVDEAHHATAEQYKRAFAPFPAAKKIGLTATPERADGTGLGDTFDVLLQTVNVCDLIAEGYLIKPLYYAAPADLAGLNTRGGDYSADEVFARVNKPQLYAQVVEKYQLHGRGYKAICFNVNVAHSKATAEAFCGAGIPAVHLDADTSADERKRILAEFASGKYQVLCNVALFTEGFDLPEIGCVVLNRPTQSRPLYHQMVGRGGRPTAGFDEETAEGRLATIAASNKPRFVVIDLGGNLKAHGYWELPIAYSLDASKKSKRQKGAAKDVSPMKECGICGLYAPQQARKCEECHHVYPTLFDRLKTGDFVEGEYGVTPNKEKAEKPVKVKPIDLWPEDCRPHYHKPAKLTDEQLKRVERLAGYSKGWAAVVIKRRGSYQQKVGVTK
jgi:DNA repair protein RadD